MVEKILTEGHPSIPHPAYRREPPQLASRLNDQPKPGVSLSGRDVMTVDGFPRPPMHIMLKAGVLEEVPNPGAAV